jgi:hypothetical protein
MKTLHLRKKINAKVNRFLNGSDDAAKALRILSNGSWRTFVFGGVLREITLSHHPCIRDLDIVIDDTGFPEFKNRFRNCVLGKNSFNGLRLLVEGFKVDAWPLSSTWAFQTGAVQGASFHRLQDTTFLNVDSILREITPNKNGIRLYGDRFMQALENQTMDIVLQDNPLPNLAAVRAIRLHIHQGFSLSKRLAEYINHYLNNTEIGQVVEQYYSHYNRSLGSEESLARFKDYVARFIAQSEDDVLVSREQLHFLEEDSFRINYRIFEGNETLTKNQQILQKSSKARPQFFAYFRRLAGWLSRSMVYKRGGSTKRFGHYYSSHKVERRMQNGCRRGSPQSIRWAQDLRRGC